MRKVAVESSNLDEVGYDEEREVMQVTFNNGRVYRYYQVPPAIFNSLLQADSKGSYFWENIRGKFEYERIY